MIPVVFSPEALEDLGAALLFLNARRPRAAERLRAAIDEAVTLLAAGGVDGPEVVLATGERVRRWLVSPTSSTTNGALTRFGSNASITRVVRRSRARIERRGTEDTNGTSRSDRNPEGLRTW